MDLSLPVGVELYRETIRSFLREMLPPGWSGYGALSPDERAAFAPAWREILLAHNLLAVSWPKEYGGGGLSLLEQSVMAAEFMAVGAPLMPLPSDSQGLILIGPTILAVGTQEQKAYFLPRILSGEHRWAQGFSEPGAGSDLAGVRLAATRHDDRWLLNGQKVWQTAGDSANWIYVLAKTNDQAARHAGLSLILVPIDQAGVDVRPIQTMTGDFEFCEVFFADAETPVRHVVGGVDNGWKTAMLLLGFERGASAAATAVASRIELDRLAVLARERGLTDDLRFRQDFAWCYSKVEIMRFLAMRMLTSALSEGRPGAEASLFKIYGSEYHQRVTELAMRVLGMDGTVVTGKSGIASLGPDPAGGPNSSAAWGKVFLTARAATIYGGSSQIQRNVIAERILGLPREPALHQ